MVLKLKSQQFISTDVVQTIGFSEAIGAKLVGGETIELISDVGGGKTTLVKGLAKGAGSHDLVHSPSFTLTNEYKGKKLKLLHFDFYRLSDPGIMKDAIEEVLNDSSDVVIVEWAGIIEDVLPEARLTIRIKTLDETKRQITIEYPEALNYLISGSIKADK